MKTKERYDKLDMIKSTRREFIQKTVVVGAATGVTGNLLASSFSISTLSQDKIRMGFIGVGNRGSSLLNDFMSNDDVEVAALCDVYEPYLRRNGDALDPEIVKRIHMPDLSQKMDKKVKYYTDFRRLLERKDIDAVCIATPDHWHAIQTIQAIESGKDVYVEKPLSITLKEGRAMVDAESRSDRIVAVGLNRRGSSMYQKLAGKVEGKVGKVSFASASRVSNMAPNGIGVEKPVDVPTGFDWDMWLGPRPYREYQYNIAPYYFRWWKEYSSQMGNWGVHYMDAIRWMLGETAPIAVTAHGGKYILEDDRNIPDTMQVLFEFKSGRIVQFSIHEASTMDQVKGGEILLSGAKGNISIDQNGYSITPATPGQFQTWNKLIEEEQYKIQSDAQYGDLNIRENSTGRLVRNFLDCIKTRKKPWCTLEDGHRSTSFAHLANISMETGYRLEWDPDTERITNNIAANDLLHYDYRAPWKL